MPRQASAIDELTRILRRPPAIAPAGKPQLVSGSHAVTVEVARMANLCSPKAAAFKELRMELGGTAVSFAPVKDAAVKRVFQATFCTGVQPPPASWYSSMELVAQAEKLDAAGRAAPPKVAPPNAAAGSSSSSSFAGGAAGWLGGAGPAAADDDAAPLLLLQPPPLLLDAPPPLAGRLSGFALRKSAPGSTRAAPALGAFFGGGNEAAFGRSKEIGGGSLVPS